MKGGLLSREYYAHSGKRADCSDWQPLREHLLNVARLARQFAEAARPGDTAFATAAEVAGLLHDLGKYRPEFQAYIRQQRSGGIATHHKQAGAARSAKLKCTEVAFAIAGHHGTLPDREDLLQLLHDWEVEGVADDIWATALQDMPELGQLPAPDLPNVDCIAGDLRTRLLFSCLVDADWVDTADHARRTRRLLPSRPTPVLAPRRSLENVLEYILSRARTCRDMKLKTVRDEVLQAALRIAEQSNGPGLFSMAIPTGAGKTLSSLAFALAHSAKHSLRRIIYVAPYLSIIEQNAAVIRAALRAQDKPGLLLEHHSLAEPEGPDEGQQDENAGRLAENWDAPVVLTTNVQLFESLFASKPGRCRKCTIWLGVW